ncbi:MAG TPA: hypothetical protein VNS19_22445 [Acidimicrobiales bacterium]|jgi:hypothetical protein|nr:hypothetical protein [Acidimicrobiales bacterium]
MSNPLTKYVAAAAVAGAVAFGGFTIAGAQDGGSSTTTTPPATSQGERPEGCDHDRGEAGTGSATDQAPQGPQTEPSTTQSSSTST